MNDMESIQIRIPPALLGWIDEQAEKDSRSRSGFIRKVLFAARDEETHRRLCQAASSHNY